MLRWAAITHANATGGPSTIVKIDAAASDALLASNDSRRTSRALTYAERRFGVAPSSTPTALCGLRCGSPRGIEKEGHRPAAALAIKQREAPWLATLKRARPRSIKDKRRGRAWAAALHDASICATPLLLKFGTR